MDFTLQNSLIHKELCLKLQNINIEDLINYYFIGPKSCGKRTLINMFIENLIGQKVKTTLNTYQIKVNNNNIEVEFRSSPYHFELNIYEYGLYDKIVLSEFVKMIGETQSISSIPYKILILYGFDKTNKLAQLSLRRMIETYYKNLRIFLVGNSYSKIDKAILSRFHNFYIPFPDQTELENLCLSINPDCNPIEIIENCNNNLNRLVYLAKLSVFSIKPKEAFKPYQKIVNKRLLDFVFNEKWTKINEIREFLLNIVLLNINLADVLKEFTIELIHENKDDEIKHKIISEIGEIDRISNLITWNIFSLEYFLLKIKNILNLGNV